MQLYSKSSDITMKQPNALSVLAGSPITAPLKTDLIKHLQKHVH